MAAAVPDGGVKVLQHAMKLANVATELDTNNRHKTLSLQRQMMENLIIARARQEALQRKMEKRRLRLQEEANRSFSSSSSLTPEEQEQRLLYGSILEYEQDHDWPKQWKANLKKNPNDLSVVSGLISCIFSCPEHPIMKLLKRLQYRIYNKLYPIVSKVTAPESPSAATCRGRNMKSSQSIHCMQSVQENNKTNSKKLRHSLSVTSLSITEDYNANTCAKEQTQSGQSTKALKLVVSMGEQDSSFEDLEQFVSQFECLSNSLPDLSKPAVDVDPLIHKLEEGVLQSHLRSIVKDIHNSIDRLLSLYILSFEPLNTAASKDQCLASIEEAFFPPIWPLLLALFRKVYGHRELAFEKSMRLYRNAKPGDMGVASKFCPSESAPGSCPYESAVQELRLISKDCCPQKKLECIVRTLRLICECAEEYHTSHEPATLHSSAAIGADDLLPILSYVALKSDLPQLVSECAALEEFIHEGYLIGEEGYCLTSMQSAVTYVESLHKGGALK
ncbi:VPS9 domain-containing protein 1-like [Acipenser oxyrinchus oxyrinchus]|uniref:VPS9 domain-containing protein 1-like n=1 Tax=Acipenser oxyrinchus oxyrinchus TaxID=40147 RepID=A0AAD8D3W7_ACIOX|nr:VPS9 domain-containing protein 1-like [Acipenser oxyrinchus oxyrinchus]